MAADYVVTSGQITLGSAATKSLWLLAAGGVEARLIDADISFDGAAAGTGIHVDLYAVTLNSTNPAGGVAGTNFSPRPLNLKQQVASTTALVNLTTEPAANSFTVASCTTNVTANSSLIIYSSNDFVAAGVAPGMVISGTNITASTTVLHVGNSGTTHYVIMSQAATGASSVTLTFQPANLGVTAGGTAVGTAGQVDVLKSWNLTPYGGLYTIQLPLGREFVLPNISPGVAVRYGLRVTTAAGITPSAVANVTIEE